MILTEASACVSYWPGRFYGPAGRLRNSAHRHRRHLGVQAELARRKAQAGLRPTPVPRADLLGDDAGDVDVDAAQELAVEAHRLRPAALPHEPVEEQDALCQIAPVLQADDGPGAGRRADQAVAEDPRARVERITPGKVSCGNHQTLDHFIAAIRVHNHPAVGGTALARLVERSGGDLPRGEVEIDLDLLALDGRDHRVIRQVGGHHLARNDVVGQDGYQLVLVFRLQQIFDRARGQLGEGLVRRGEDGERSVGLQRVDETAGLQRRGEGREVAGRYRGVDDVGFLLAVTAGLGAGGEHEGGCEQRGVADHFLGEHGEISSRVRVVGVVSHIPTHSESVL